ncbi:MAG TPA: ATP synthase subunit I [Candidatus Acidoferrales bacterium]|nr:ATP synthase subunit I [Candidatus Acidoferrales bacterium]
MNEDLYLAIERRIEFLIIGLGVFTALGALVGSGTMACAGLAVGTTLCWLNFRWLRHKATALIRLGLAQSGVETVRVPKRVYVGSFGRLGLLLVIVYVILVWFRLPVIAVLCGLSLFIPAVVIELLYEVMSGLHRSTLL